jgi:hypothetical protein
MLRRRSSSEATSHHRRQPIAAFEKALRADCGRVA